MALHNYMRVYFRNVTRKLFPITMCILLQLTVVCEYLIVLLSSAKVKTPLADGQSNSLFSSQEKRWDFPWEIRLSGQWRYGVIDKGTGSFFLLIQNLNILDVSQDLHGSYDTRAQSEKRHHLPKSSLRQSTFNDYKIIITEYVARHLAAICQKIILINIKIYDVYNVNGTSLDVISLCSAQHV